jgi:eukaryotic-like serine/threonine-protein kinase
MQPENMVGQTLGHYRIVRQVGYGGMSTVFLAEDIHLGREVALKVFWPRPGETKDFLRRFGREARVLAQLDHPNILPVYDYGEQDGHAYLVMPYMAGGSLKDMLKARQVLSPADAIRLTTEVLNALQYAHERGLIHRDIKPGNMLFKADGKLMLCDFGLVKVMSPEGATKSPFDTASETGPAITGTPEYMPPEQIHGQPTPASDIYSIGIVLYEMLTGTRPFTSNSVMSVLMKQLSEQPRPLREINPNISPQLESVVLRALDKDPARRYQRPIDFLQALRQAEMSGGVAGSVISMPTTPTNWSTPFVKDIQGPSPIPPAMYSAVDEANMETVASDPQPYPQRSAQPISHPGVPYQAANVNTPATITPHGRYPQGIQQPISHPGMAQGGYVPPPARRSSRLPVVILVILLFVLASLVLALVVTPLGHNLFGNQAPGAGNNPQGTTANSGITPGTTTGTKGGNVTPAPNTQGMPATSTSCPATGTARAFVSAPLVLGQDQTIVYIVNEGPANAPTFGTVKRYDTITGNKVEINKMANTRIDDAQVSADGQWVLFTAHVAGQSELRALRMDGQGLQTLFCAPAGYRIFGAQWSINQKLVVFDVGQDTGGTTIYLLNMADGSLQTELVSASPGLAYLPRTWLDNRRVLLVGFAQNADAPPQNVYILDTRKGANQHTTDLQQVVTLGQPCWDFDSSFDSTKLFVSQCTPGQPEGSSTVGVQPATGGTLNTFFTSSTLAINSVRVIDPNNTYLLATATNMGMGVSGDTSNDGLYKLKTDGSTLLRLTADNAGETSNLNSFSQYFWSNVSRDGKMYALEMSNFSTGTYTLMFGSLNGGAPTTFASISGTVLEIAGWTKM